MIYVVTYTTSDCYECGGENVVYLGAAFDSLSALAIVDDDAHTFCKFWIDRGANLFLDLETGRVMLLSDDSDRPIREWMVHEVTPPDVP